MNEQPTEAKPNVFDAIKSGDLGKVRELVDADPRVKLARDSAGRAPALFAAYFGRADMVAVLLRDDAELDVVEAAVGGRLARVRELLAQDPSLANAYSADGFAVLGLAAAFGTDDVIDALLHGGADPNAVARNGTGYTPLTAAVGRADAKLVAKLLEAGARADYVYTRGYTPLHEAAANNRVEIVRLLLAAGADPGAQLTDGRTPHAMAIAQGHTEAAALLQ